MKIITCIGFILISLGVDAQDVQTDLTIEKFAPVVKLGAYNSADDWGQFEMSREFTLDNSRILIINHTVSSGNGNVSLEGAIVVKGDLKPVKGKNIFIPKRKGQKGLFKQT